MIALLTALACALPLQQEEPEAPRAPPRSVVTSTTPAQSLAARPRWTAPIGYAPTAPTRLLERGDKVEGPVQGGLLICELRSDLEEQRLRRRARAPDLQATLRFGDTRTQAVNPDDQRVMRISAPLAALKPGDIVRIDVYDRQLFRVRGLGVLETGYVGMPVSLTAPQLDARCAYVPHDTVEGELSAPLTEADQAIERWHPAPGLDDDSLGLPDHAVEARAAVERTAALVGWADPRVTPLVTRFDRALASHEALLGRAVSRQRDAPHPGQPAPSLAWSTGRLLPDDDAIRATLGDTASMERAIVLPIHADRELRAVGDTLGPVEGLEYVDLHGAWWPLRVWGLRQGGVLTTDTTMGPGEADVILTPSDDYYGATPQAAGLIRGRVDGDPVFVTVDLPAGP